MDRIDDTKGIYVFQFDQQFCFLGKLSIKEQKLKFLNANFEICWPNFQVVQWNQGMLQQLQTYISNHLDIRKGLVAVFDFSAKSIRIVKKKMIKKSQTVDLAAQKLALQSQLSRIAAIITNCFSFSGLKKSVLTKVTQKDRVLFYNKYFKAKLTERRFFNYFLRQFLLRKPEVTLSPQNETDKLELTFPRGQGTGIKSEFNEYFQKINKYLAKFVAFFKENGKQYRNRSKIQQVHEFSQITGDIQIHGGVSKVIKVYVNGNLLNAATSQEIYVQDGCLAKKCFKEEEGEKKSEDIQRNNRMRFDREVSQIKYLSNANSILKDCYLMNYYYYKNGNQNYYYADWHELSLNAYLKIHQGMIRIHEKLHLAIQAIMIVLDLHKIGMVHRDIKSSNFMLDTSGKRVPVLKIIDMSDSMVIGDEQMLKQVQSGSPRLYSTPLNCPIETSTLHNEHKEIGLNQKEIDFWSVGILLYEIFLGHVPISYSSVTSKDILELWPKQFLPYVTQRPRNNVLVVYQIIVFLSFSLCKVNQKQRMGLETALMILLATYRYLKRDEEVHSFFHQSGNMSAA